MLLINKLITINAKLCGIHISWRFSFLILVANSPICYVLCISCEAFAAKTEHVQLSLWRRIFDYAVDFLYLNKWAHTCILDQAILSINKMFFASVYRTFRKPSVARILFRMYEIFHPICSCANLQGILDFFFQNVHGGLDPRFKSVISE